MIGKLEEKKVSFMRRWLRKLRRRERPIFHDEIRRKRATFSDTAQIDIAKIETEVMGEAGAEAIHRLKLVQERAQPLRQNELAAISILHPKIAAIVYGRIWYGVSLWEPAAPLELLFSVADEMDGGHGALLEWWIMAPKETGATSKSVAEYYTGRADHYEAIFSEYTAQLARRTKSRVATVFGTQHGYQRAFASGDLGILVAALDRVPLINEEDLLWEQVLEIRSDYHSRRVISQLIDWTENTLVGKTAEQIGDELEYRLEEYKQALKKHGISSIAGLGETLILGAGGVITAIAAPELVGLTVTAGPMALSITKKMIDFGRERNKMKAQSPVAFLAGL